MTSAERPSMGSAAMRSRGYRKIQLREITASGNSAEGNSAKENSEWRTRAPDHPHIVPVRAFQDNYIWMIVLDTPTQRARRSWSTRAMQTRSCRPWKHRACRLPASSSPTIMRTTPAASARSRRPGLRRSSMVPASARTPSSTGASTTAIDVAIEDLGHRLPGHRGARVTRWTTTPTSSIGSAAIPRPVLFCGDTLFAGGCGRVFEGTPAMMYESLARLAALPPQTLVYCAHEYTLANLRFARAAEPANEATSARLQEAEAIREARPGDRAVHAGRRIRDQSLSARR